MKKDYKLLAGSALLLGALFQLTKSLHVTSAMFSRFHIGSFYFGNGILIIPILAGLVWLIASNGKSRIAPLLMIGGVACLLIGILATANIRLVGMSFYSWIMLLIFFFSGVGLIISSFRDSIDDKKAEREKEKKTRKKPESPGKSESAGKSESGGNHTAVSEESIEKELYRMKEENKWQH